MLKGKPASTKYRASDFCQIPIRTLNAGKPDLSYLLTEFEGGACDKVSTVFQNILVAIASQ
jgi:hypothetical protein